MWRSILLLGALGLAGLTSGRSLYGVNNSPLWDSALLHRDRSLYYTNDDTLNELPIDALPPEPNSVEDLLTFSDEENGDPLNSDEDTNRISTEIDDIISSNEKDVGDKRGFSMLARWRPFNSIGRQRVPIRQGSQRPSIPLDIVSAETRAMMRPIGQPLRWG